MYIDQKNLYFSDMNSNLVHMSMTQDNKIIETSAVMPQTKIKPQYIYIGIASIIIIIILNNK